MDETDTRIGLRKSGYALLDAGHADQHHTGGSLVEDRSHLFEAVHLEAIGLVHKDQSSRVRHCSLFSLVLLVRLKVCWIDRRAVARRATWFVHDFPTTLLVFKSDLLQHHRRFAANRVEYDTHHSLSRHLDVVFDPGGSIDHRSCIKQGVDRAIVCYFACPAVARNDLICAAVAHSGECFANAGWSIAQS